MRGRHGSLHHCAHLRPNFTGDRCEVRGHGAAHAALPPGSLHAGCACWCAPDGFAARQRRGGTHGACNAGRRAPRRPSAGVELADGVIEATPGRRARARRAHDARGHHARPILPTSELFVSIPNSAILRQRSAPVRGCRPRLPTATSIAVPPVSPAGAPTTSALDMMRAS